MTEEPEPEVSEYEEIWATLEDPFGEWTEDDMKELYHLVRGRILQKALKVVMDQMGSLADKSLALCPLTKSMDMEEHDYFNETPTYITNLVNYYCENVINVCIDWKNMNDSHLKGFKCCKKLLCVSDDVIKYEWIKLNTFLTLFPNLKELHVRNIKLSQFTIKDIHKFLSKAKENNKYDDLYRIEIFEVDQSEYPIAECLNQYLDKFKEVGWTITFNPFEDEMCILKI